MLRHPQLRVYIIVPIIVNFLLFIVLTGGLLTYYSNILDSGASFVPEKIQPWLAPLKWIAWIIFVPLLLIIYGYTFNVITNVIAAPFYGKLAEATERLHTGQALAPETLSQMILRVFPRELTKLSYFLLRGLLVILLMLLIGVTPVVQILAPLIGLAWGAWSMSIQYADYAADNHKVPFSTMRNALWSRIRTSTGFGAAIMACSVIPVINIFCIPAAVIGGTLYWLNELHPQIQPQK